MFRFAPAATILLVLGPVAAGLAGTVLPAFGYLPALGGTALSLDPWRVLAGTPGLDRSVAVALIVGLSTTALSLAVVLAISAASYGTVAFAFARRTLSPLLAVPHVAVALGLAFVMAPSGLAFRIFATFTGWPDRPPDLLIVNDPWGLSLCAGLSLKEIPFLFLMLLAALPQTDADRSLAVARSLGYGRVAAWLKVVVPRLYPQMRLPVLAVLAYSVSAVDVALVLGPTTPPLLAVRIVQWMSDPDLALRFVAAAGAVLQAVLVVVALAAWRLGELALSYLARDWLIGGTRRAGDAAIRGFAAVTGAAMLVVLPLAAYSLVAWSFADFWTYPQAAPAAWTLRNWTGEGARVGHLLANSLLVALLASALSLVLAVGWLENDVRRGREYAGSAALWIVYVPLVAPQIAYLPGIQILLVRAALDETLAAVVLVHVVYVLPYVFLSLSDPWRTFDARYRLAAAGLGASPDRFLFRIRLPMLLRALLTAFALGVAVSIGQYVATALVAGAHWPTITTEAIALSAGGNRRIVAIYALLQSAIPFVGFFLALAIPAIVFRNRRALRGAG
ncbi:MAG: ABC transporter permease subunit [Alphaproteobacteria bacterium]|nr:ABC transporter permease subunit [Alphaproteobacteria bacterium]